MIVDNLLWSGFGSYKDAGGQALAPNLTLLVGDNGSGKSTLLEMLAWACYGESIRGGSPLRTDCPTEVRVDFRLGHGREHWTIARQSSKGKTTLSLMSTTNGVNHSGQTNTETQQHIDQLLGSWQQFASTRFFAREFMARFGAATDKERKTLLEGILGLERFDEALAKARADLNLQEKTNAGLERELQVYADNLSRYTARLATMKSPGRPIMDVEAEIRTSRDAGEDALAKERELDQMLAGANRATAEAEANVASKERVELAGLHARINELERKKQQVKGLERCPMCLQQIEDGALGVSRHYQGEIDQLRLQLDCQMVEMSQLHEELQDLREERRAIEDRYREAKAAVAGLRARSSELAAELAVARAFEGERSRLEAEVSEYETKRLGCQVALDQGHHRQDILAACVEALGLRGARTLLLGRALGRLEAQANLVLLQLGFWMRVSIKGTTTQKSGREVDAISIAIQGAGADVYEALSSGERARVDVALLLGLAALSGGQAWGLVAFDEVFDSLDQDGVERVAQYLAQLGEERQVIVISHHPDLRALFPRATVLRAQRDAQGSSTLGPG